MFCISCGFSVICCNKLCIPGVLNILAESLLKKKKRHCIKEKTKVKASKYNIYHMSFSELQMSIHITNQLNQERILKLRSPKLHTQHIPVKEGLRC